MGGIELVVTLHGRGRACPARRFAWADVCGWLPRGWPLAEGFAGRRGRRPLRFAREWAAAGASPSSGPAGPPSPKGEGKGCCWRRRKVSRGVEDAAPCGLPGNGRQREPAPHPALRGHLPPRGKARAVVGGGARFRGASRTPRPAVCPGMGGSGSLPLIRPCGAAFPPRGKARAVVGGRGRPPTPAVGPRCGVGGSGCSTSGLTKPALYRRNPGRCRGGSRR